MPRVSIFHGRSWFVVLVFLVAATVAANAGSSVGVQLTGAGGAEYGLGQNYAYGEYLMPYYVSINSAVPIAVICDDFDHTVSIGDHWTASISTFGNLSGTRFGTADSMQYHEAAWLSTQINSNSTLADITAAQFAIWRLFTSDTPTNIPGESAWLAAAATAAANNFYGMDFSFFRILTPINPASPQEYFFIPEPGVLFDLLAGLAAFGAIWISRQRRRPSRVNV